MWALVSLNQPQISSHPLLSRLQALPHSGPALITAPWPKASGAVDDGALASFAIVQDVVKSIRNARSEYNVETTRKIGAQLVAEAPAAREALQAEAPVRSMRLLST